MVSQITTKEACGAERRVKALRDKVQQLLGKCSKFAKETLLLKRST